MRKQNEEVACLGDHQVGNGSLEVKPLVQILNVTLPRGSASQS